MMTAWPKSAVLSIVRKLAQLHEGLTGVAPNEWDLLIMRLEPVTHAYEIVNSKDDDDDDDTDDQIRVLTQQLSLANAKVALLQHNRRAVVDAVVEVLDATAPPGLSKLVAELCNHNNA